MAPSHVETTQYLWHYVVNVAHFAVLYLAGAYHLVRQILFSRRLPLHTDTSITHHTSPPPTGTDTTKETTIILTGATSGIGRALLQHLLTRSNISLICVSRRPVDTHIPTSIRTVEADLQDEASTRHAVDTLRDMLPIAPGSDVLFFHCAGVYDPRSAERTLTVNTCASALLLFGLREVVSQVVVLGSVTQFVAPYPRPWPCHYNQAGYAASKALVLGVAAAWQHETGKSALVVHPGVVDTALYEGQRGVLGVVLRACVRYMGWSAEYSARRVLHVLNEAERQKQRRKQRSETSGKDKDKGDGQVEEDEIYWDTVTLTYQKLPFRLQYINTKFTIYQLLKSMGIRN